MKLTDKQQEKMKEMLSDITHNWPHRKGKLEVVKHLSKKCEVTRGESILGMCYVCCGGYEMGGYDCKEAICPLYKWMPYREEKDRIAMPEDQKIEMLIRFQKGRENAQAKREESSKRVGASKRTMPPVPEPKFKTTPAAVGRKRKTS
jgi:hypothetical protein